mmetsp:Transcript_16194/g.39165  ORF Transcript_16194/g.39165 Transcript_16194/m.39165 type:complete len:147 (-) Transcript_16194:1055-1495(-)
MTARVQEPGNDGSWMIDHPLEACETQLPPSLRPSGTALMTQRGTMTLVWVPEHFARELCRSFWGRTGFLVDVEEQPSHPSPSSRFFQNLRVALPTRLLTALEHDRTETPRLWLGSKRQQRRSCGLGERVSAQPAKDSDPEQIAREP